MCMGYYDFILEYFSVFLSLSQSVLAPTVVSLSPFHIQNGLHACCDVNSVEKNAACCACSGLNCGSGATGYRPVASDPFLAANPSLPPPLSDRMRKRRAFADKELESIMLEREYKERELLENSGQAAAAAAAAPPPQLLFPGGVVHHHHHHAAAAAAEYSYKSAYSPPLHPLEVSVAYPPGPANLELISSNVSVATTYCHYPLAPARGGGSSSVGGGFMVWPRTAAATNLGDALLYQQCLFNATALHNAKPGAVWEPKVAPTESQPPEQQQEVGGTALVGKLEGSRVTAAVALQDVSEASGPQQRRECSAFSPPRRSNGQSLHAAACSTRSPHSTCSTRPAQTVGAAAEKPIRDGGAKLSLRLNSFQSLIQHSLSERSSSSSVSRPELKAPYCRELLEEAARQLRGGCSSSTSSVQAGKASDGSAKDFVSKAAGSRGSSGSLSFSVEAILKRPTAALSQAFH